MWTFWNGWKSLVNDRKRKQNEGKKVTESAAISNHGWFYSRSFSHFYPECYQSLPLIRCRAHGMTPFRVIEFYAENIENKSNVTNFYAYVDVEDDSQRHEKTNWENFRLFLTWKRTRFLHSKSIRCASRQSQMVARLICAARNSNVTERYEHEAYSRVLIEKLVQQNSPRYNLVTSGKKGSNNEHLIIASHNFSSMPSREREREQAESKLLNEIKSIGT